MRHFGFHLLTLLGDGVADFFADCGGFDNVVGSVDFGEMLAFDCGFGGLQDIHVSRYHRIGGRRSASTTSSSSLEHRRGMEGRYGGVDVASKEQRKC